MNGRVIENALALLGGLTAVAYVGFVEILPHACYAIGRCTVAPVADHGVPWGVVILVAAMVMPKTVGRATTGKVWEAIASRLARVTGKTPAPPEP